MEGKERSNKLDTRTGSLSLVLTNLSGEQTAIKI
jgi:hypothetical protein